MTATVLAALLITLGDPGRLTGGYLYHLRMAELAPRNAARVDFVSFPERPFPLAAFAAGSAARRLRELDPHAILLDSIAAAFYAPWLRVRHPGVPVVAILH